LAPLGMAMTGITQRARPDMTRRFHDVIDPAIAAPGQPVDLARPATPRQGGAVAGGEQIPAGGPDDVLGFAK
jgi:hypothetical protein